MGQQPKVNDDKSTTRDKRYLSVTVPWNELEKISGDGIRYYQEREVVEKVSLKGPAWLYWAVHRSSLGVTTMFTRAGLELTGIGQKAPVLPVPWQDLELTTGDGDQLSPLDELELLHGFKQGEGLPSWVRLIPLGLGHERAEDPGTWGPQDPRDVNWENFMEPARAIQLYNETQGAVRLRRVITPEQQSELADIAEIIGRLEDGEPGMEWVARLGLTTPLCVGGVKEQTLRNAIDHYLRLVGFDGPGPKDFTELWKAFTFEYRLKKDPKVTGRYPEKWAGEWEQRLAEQAVELER